MKKFSKQREAILSVLRETKSHPTASWIYEEVKKQIPNISLGTVYRNLSELSSSGKILCIDFGDGHEHYDADVSSHLHLCCNSCHEIKDIYLKEDLCSKTAKREGFIPETSVLVTYGICKNCK